MIFSWFPQYLYLELEQGLDQTKSLYHKKEFRRAVESLEEVLSTSSNRRLLSEVEPNTVRAVLINSLFRLISCWRSVTKDWET